MEVRKGGFSVGNVITPGLFKQCTFVESTAVRG